MMRHHAGAGAGGKNDPAIGREKFDIALGKVDGARAVAGIVIGLTATGLILGKDDNEAGGFEQAPGGKTDLRSEKIDETGDEERDFARRGVRRRGGKRGGTGHDPGAE